MSWALVSWFVCRLCDRTLSARHRCESTQNPEEGPCVQCCGCALHTVGADPGGRVVLDFTRPRPWRGIGSAWRMRRHV